MSASEAKLDDVLDFYNGKAPPKTQSGAYPVFGSNGQIGWSDNFNHERAIIIGRVGAYCGSIEVCAGKFWASDNTIVVKPKPENDLKYMYYKLGSMPLRGYAGGAAQPLLTQGVLKSVKSHFADPTTQLQISKILENYDSLIENNKRRIELLENSARQLYKEWFVRFRFPGHEHVKIIDGVPEGWELKKLRNLFAKIKRAGKIKKEEYVESGAFPCVDQSQNFIGGYTDNHDAVIKEPLPLVIFGDHTRILKFVDFPFACGADGTQILYPNDDRLSIEYFYFSLLNVDLSNHFYARHFKFLKDQEILIPSEWYVKAFTEFAYSNMQQISKLRDQCLQLSKARDILLPKLMSGEIAI